MPSNNIQCGILCAVLTFTNIPVWGESTPQDHTHFEYGQTLTANSLVSWVLERSPGLASIQAAAEAAAHRIVPAGALDDPTLNYAAAPLTANGDRGLNQKIEFRQKIPWPGTLAARKAAARHEAISADRNVDSLRLHIIAQAKAAYAEWRFVDEGLTIHHTTHILLEELVATAQARYAAGRALKQDVLRAEVEQAELDNDLLRLRRQQTTVRARINALLNRAPNAPLPPASPASKTIVPPELKMLQTKALEQHPELTGLDAQISANQSRVILAKKAFLPNFQLEIGHNSLWDDPDKRNLLGVTINVPFDQRKRRSELSRAKAETQRTQWSLIERRADLLSGLAQARAEVFEAQASIELHQSQLVPLAAEYLETTLSDYQSGNGSFSDVIIAEKRKLSTDLALARVRADYIRRFAELERWVGGPITPQQLSGEQP